jgi:hypothetical protein
MSRKNFLPTFNYTSLSNLRVLLSKNAEIENFSDLKLSWNCFAMPKDSSLDSNSSGIFKTSLCLIDRIFCIYDQFDSVIELFAPILDILKQLRPQEVPILPTFIQLEYVLKLENLLKKFNEKRESRAPLQWRKKIVKSLSMKEPRFDLDYTFKKDIDPNHER